MKKIFSFITVLAVALLLVACTNSDPKGDEITQTHRDVVADINGVGYQSGDAWNKVTKDVTLKTTTTVTDKATITWTSDKPAVISNAGVVTRGAADETVVLTLTVTIDNVPLSENFTNVVLKNDGTVDPTPNPDGLGKLYEFDFATTTLGNSYSSNVEAARTITDKLNTKVVNVISTRTAANNNHGTYTDAFMVMSASTKDGLTSASIVFEIPETIKKITFDAAFWSSFDAEQTTKLVLQSKSGETWTDVFDINAALASTLEYKAVVIADINVTTFRIYAEGTAPTGSGNNGARTIFDNLVLWGEGGTTVDPDPVDPDPVDPDPVDPTPTDGTTVTASYSGATAKFAETGNNAALIGLDATLFNVTGSVIIGPTYTNPIGLNKDGTIRLYADKETSNGNLLTVTIASGYEITGVEIAFANSTNEAIAVLTLTEAVNLAATQVKGQTVTHSGLALTTFTLQNTTSVTAQVWISSIKITYKSK